MTDFLKNMILNIGDRPEFDGIDRTKNRLYNAFLSFSIIAISLTLLTNLISWSWTPFDNLVYISGYSIIAACFYLNARRQQQWSMLTLMFSSMIILFLMTTMSGDIFLTCMINLLLQSFVFAFINSKKLIAIILTLQLLIIISTIAVVNSSYYEFGDQGYSPIFRSILYSIGFILLAVTLGYLKSHIRSIGAKNFDLIDKLKKKNEELSLAYEDMERFSYAVSHDLKAPLRSINSFAQLISINIKKENYIKVDESSKFITTNATKLSTMIDDILNYSKLNQNKSELIGAIDLNLLIEEIQSELTHYDRPFNLIYGTLGMITGNVTKVKMLFQNLIDNSIKYNESKLPEVKISSYQNNYELKIEVTDNGIGLSKEDEADAFALFKRIDTSSEYEGSGVGLANCKRIVEIHLGGTISIADRESDGTTFIITIPQVER